MRYGKWFISLFTAALVFAVVIFGISEYSWDGTIGITAQVSSQEGEETLQCWEVRWSNEDKRGYFFLPAYADLSELRLQKNASNPIYLDGREIKDGMTCEEFQTGVPYDLYYRHRGREYHFTLTFLQSANIPAMYIDTASGSLDYIHEKKGNKEPGSLRLYNPDGTLDSSGTLDSIGGRGNSTWEYEKKPYNLTLSRDTDLLGMGAAQRWILLANAIDGSHMRNKIAYDMARDMGMEYSPECRWVDLYVNGAYVGLYLLSERNEVHSQRVDIGGEGSFLVIKDWAWRFREEKEPYFETEANTALQIRYSALTETELRQTMQSLENAILAEDGIDPVTGKHWQDLIDLDSWVKKYLLEEALGNVDASTLSQFYYREGTDGKIMAGPLWDMDLTLGDHGSYWMRSKDQFYGNDPENYGSLWLPELYQEEVFFDRLTEVYETEMLPLLTQLKEEGIAAYAEWIRQAAAMDFARWDDTAMDRALQDVYAYLDKRLEFLDRIWVRKEPYVVITVSDEGSAGRVVLEAGATLSDLPAYADTEDRVYYGWYYRGTDTPVDPQSPVWEDIGIELRWEDIQ